MGEPPSDFAMDLHHPQAQSIPAAFGEGLTTPWLGLPSEQIKEVPFAYQVGDTLRDVGFLAVVNTGCICVQIVPGVGSVLGVCGSYYFNCFTFGIDFLDHPLALRGIRRREKRAFAKRHRTHTLGLGTAVLGITLLPVINAVLLTTAVTGAVLLHRRLAASDDDHALPEPGS